MSVNGPWTDKKRKKKERKNINGVGYRVAAQLKTKTEWYIDLLRN